MKRLEKSPITSLYKPATESSKNNIRQMHTRIAALKNEFVNSFFYSLATSRRNSYKSRYKICEES